MDHVIHTSVYLLRKPAFYINFSQNYSSSETETEHGAWQIPEPTRRSGRRGSARSVCAHLPAWAPRSPGRGLPRDRRRWGPSGQCRQQAAGGAGTAVHSANDEVMPSLQRGTSYTAKDRHPDKGLKAIARFSSFAAEPGLGQPAAACTPHPAPGGAQGGRCGAAFQVDTARLASSPARPCHREPRCATKQDKVANLRTPAPRQPGSRGGGKKVVPERAVDQKTGNGADCPRHRRWDTDHVKQATKGSAG